MSAGKVKAQLLKEINITCTRNSQMHFPNRCDTYLPPTILAKFKVGTEGFEAVRWKRREMEFLISIPPKSKISTVAAGMLMVGFCAARIPSP